MDHWRVIYGVSSARGSVILNSWFYKLTPVPLAMSSNGARCVRSDSHEIINAGFRINLLRSGLNHVYEINSLGR